MKNSVLFLLVLLVVGIVYQIYLIGYGYGSNSVKIKWDTEKKETQEKIQSIQNTYTLLVKTHNKASEGLKDDIIKLKKKYETELNSTKSEYTSRLHNSEKRASLYKHQAESGTTQCRDLAAHAARLDRTLERGRDLVQRLRITLRQRELEIGVIGSQLLLDRNTLDKAGSVDG